MVEPAVGKNVLRARRSDSCLVLLVPMFTAPSSRTSSESSPGEDAARASYRNERVRLRPSIDHPEPAELLPDHFLRLNAAAINVLLREAGRPAACLLLAGLLGLLGAPAWAGGVRSEAQASRWLEQALPTAGPGAESLAGGLRQFQAGEYAAAVTLFTQAEKQGAGGPVEEAALYLIGESMARSSTKPQEIHAAIKALEDARRRYRKSSRAGWSLWRTGSLYRKLGFDPEAIAIYERLLREEPADSPLAPFLRHDLADAYTAQGRYAQAARHFQTVREMTSDDVSLAEATIGLANVSYALAQYDVAGALYKIAEAKWPNLIWSKTATVFAMGDSFLNLKQWPRAQQIFIRGYNLYPRDEAAPLMLARLADGLRRSGQSALAGDLYRTVIERHPQTEGELFARLGLAELAEGKEKGPATEKDAQEQYLAIIARWSERPAAAESLFRLGQSYQRAGDIVAAAAAYDQLLARSDAGSLRVKTRQALQVCLQSLDESGKSLEVATLFFRHRDLLTTPKMDGATGVAIGGALVRLGLGRAALQVTRASLSANLDASRQERALVTLAEAYLLQNDLPQVDRAWQEYLRKFSRGRWSAEAQEWLVTALVRSDRGDEADALCRQWLAAGVLLHKPIGSAAGGPGMGGVLACADMWSDMGKAQAALGLYTGLLQSTEDTIDTLWAAYQAAGGHAALGHHEQAAELFDRVAKSKLDPALAAAARLAMLEAPPSRE